MFRRLILCLLFAVPAWPLCADDSVDFARDVQPILSNHCFTCHGPDSNTREAGLRLDDLTSAMEELDSGAVAVVAGDVEASELLVRVNHPDSDLRMPPAEGGKSLSLDQIETLTTWIEQGAEYPQHWAFVPPAKNNPPAVSDVSWPANEIDPFVLARLEAVDRKPTREASRESLIRRVSFDVTGLPPTISEIDRYLHDKSPRAYEAMVDRYLESSAYGEHMARNWLDLARYADSNGYQYDTEREQWVWRDWVIDAFNRNLPFDQFSIEQLSGDLLADATDQQRLATGFNRNHGITIEGGIIDEEYRVEYVMDRLVTSGSVWMGLTIGCARCHDHKFDPLSQREFYQLYAYFNQVPEKGMNGFEPREKIVSPFAQERLKELRDEIAELRLELEVSVDDEADMEEWVEGIVGGSAGWRVLVPESMSSSGGSTLKVLEDHSVLAGDANPSKDIYDIVAETNETAMTAVRLQALTHDSLPGSGPGRHSNSNFVLSEFELTVVSIEDPSRSETIKFVLATADYSQNNYDVRNAIDGTVRNNNGWAVDGPTRKEPATAIFVAEQPFGFAGGSELWFRLRHEADFATHGIGRPRLSVTTDDPTSLPFDGPPAELLGIARKARDERSTDEQSRLIDYYVTNHSRRKSIRERIAALEGRMADSYPATMVMRELANPRSTFVLDRGQYNQPTTQVSMGIPEFFSPLTTAEPANRLGFARWLFAPSHPLTARVAVNRYWQQLFGIGLVKTVEDFGIQGEPPSHPLLLDWLAVEFVESGWDTKHLLRLILNSATYRQSPDVGQVEYESDPENRWLARGPRVRLSAEAIRDNALSVSGLLVEKLGGKSVYPYQPDGLWLELNNRPGYSQAYQRGTGDELYRRSLYTFWKRTVPSPMLKTFDVPEREFCTIQRSRTNTPLQSLLLLNGVQFVEAARHLGKRIMDEGGDSLNDRIEYGFRLVTSRRPTDEEVELFRSFYEEQTSRFQSDRESAVRLLSVGDSPQVPDRDVVPQAAWTMLSRLLLNLDEAITKG